MYEDEYTLAFLDIHPTQPGHTIVIPKEQIEFIWDLDDQTYLALMSTVKKVGLMLREVMGKPFVGLKVFGMDVPHVHVHLIPFSTAAEFNNRQDMQAEPDHKTLAETAEKLRF